MKRAHHTKDRVILTVAWILLMLTPAACILLFADWQAPLLADFGPPAFLQIILVWVGVTELHNLWEMMR